MEKFIPYQKLPKKKQQELDRQRRGSWNGVNPVTRKPENSKVYNRNKAQRWKRENGDALLIYMERPALCPMLGQRFAPTRMRA